ncbi:MAG: DUF1598 domain-containing protein [Planctomycetaceae bacterium]|nr:DUF1598 domain-containing protein [Planctomycetaceae bacterium]
MLRISFRFPCCRFTTCCLAVALGVAVGLTAVRSGCAESKAAADTRKQPAAAFDDAAFQARLEAGEHGPALDMALALPANELRDQKLRELALAQRLGTDGAAVQSTTRRRLELRSRKPKPDAGSGTQAGGGSQADFTELIDLIKSTLPENSDTEANDWDDNGGPGQVKPYNTGVYVDPKGILKLLTKEEANARLAGLARRARVADLNDDLAESSPLRLLSLRKLEKAVAERLAAGLPIPETMNRLAGITSVRYLFISETDGDILIGGPAEGWKYDANGRPVGRDSGRPMLQLDDLVVVLRSFAPGGDENFGCSINTRDANLKNVKDFVEGSQQAGPLGPGKLGGWLKQLQARLGMQDVVVHGVPANTHVAQVLVEADYRMKLIGVAKLDGGKEIPSYFKLMQSAGGVKGASLEALRWWMTMKYDAILHSPDRNAFEFQGSSVLVQSENQFVNAHGQHVPTGVSEPINRRFAENFTEHYADLAQRDPVFADMRNIFDLALVAVLCRVERVCERLDWNLGAFAPNGAFVPAAVYAPREVESVINHRVYNGKDIVVQVAGGVQVDLTAIARDENLAKEDADLSQAASRAQPARAIESQWWWDAPK